MMQGKNIFGNNTNRKVVKGLHLIMLALCCIATAVLFGNPSTLTKLLISVLLILYTLSIVLNSQTVRLLFKIGEPQSQTIYQNLHSWELQTSKEPPFNNNYSLPNSTNFPFNNTEYDGQNHSFSRSFDRSVDIKNMSLSVYRSLSASGINDSRVSRMKSSMKRKDKRGFQLSEAFSNEREGDLSTSSLRTQPSGMVLVDYHTHLHNATRAFQAQAEKEYEKGLKRYLKKDRKSVTIIYQSILGAIKATVNCYLNEHNFTKAKLGQLCLQHLQLTLQPPTRQANYELIARKDYVHQKMPLNLFLYRLLLLKEDRITFKDAGLPLKQGKRWISLQARFQELLKTMVDLSQSLGVDSSILKSHFKDSTQEFVENYLSSIEMIEVYLKHERHFKPEERQNLNSATLYKLSKCRTFVLSLMVRSINSCLKNIGKIKFNGQLNSQNLKYDSYQLQITKKAGSQDPLMHFDLLRINNNQMYERISCQPGQVNFLSVLFMVMKELIGKNEVLNWSSNLRVLVNDLL